MNTPAGRVRDGLLSDAPHAEGVLRMLSTKMMPSVGVLVPIYLLWKNSGLLHTVRGLVIVYTLINLPIAVLDVVHLLRPDSARHSRSGPHRDGIHRVVIES